MSVIRIAFSTLAFPEASLATAASLGRSFGYDGIELRLVDGELIDPRMPLTDRAAVKRTVDDAGLPIVAVDTSIRLTDTELDPAQDIRAFLELASDWEAPVIRVFGGALAEHGPARQERLAAAARVLEAAVPVAERLGVDIGVETHDSFSASATVAELLSLVGSPHVGAVWDSHHPHRMGEHPAEIYANIGDRLLLAQVKDARRAPDRADGWQLVLLGDGEVPVRDMLTLLAASGSANGSANGYPSGCRGWVSVEWEKHWHREIEPPEVALPQYLALLRRWLGEMA